MELETKMTFNEFDDFGGLPVIDITESEYKKRDTTVQCKSNCIIGEFPYDKFLDALLSDTRIHSALHILKNNEYFKPIKDNILEKIASHAKIMTFKAHDIIYKEGEETNGFYLINMGEFKVFKMCEL